MRDLTTDLMPNPTPNRMNEDAHELTRSLRSYFAARVPTQEVDDLVQECLVRVYAGVGGLRDEERFGPWLGRIAGNLLVDFRRKRSADSLGEIDPAAPMETPDDTATVSSWFASMIDKLEPEYRDALALSELGELPHREIAERVGLSISGVKSRVQRGRRKLRDQLLACCQLEFDRRGGIADWQPRNSCDC